ncbi:jg1579, partial [Pararge aegeria aegeria]
MNKDNMADGSKGVSGHDLFKNSDSNQTPTSEVGSLLRSLSAGHDVTDPDIIIGPSSADVSSAVTPQQISQTSPTDPVALPSIGNVIPPQFFLQMMTMMQSMSDRLLQKPSERVKITDIFLPSFDPDGSVGVREWCNHISTAVSTYKLTDYDIRMKVNSLLKGRARIWADNWLVTTSTWDELRETIITTFEPENRYSRDILKFREHIYSPNKNISEFLSEGWLLWRRVTKDKLDNSDAVEAVIGMVSDERLRIELMNVRAKTVPELISVASSIRTKRPNMPPPHSNTPPQKRARFSQDHRNIPQCSFCNKLGHVWQNCRNRNESSHQIKQPIPSSSTAPTTAVNVSKYCSFCAKPGHTFDTCFRREKQVASNVNSITNDNKGKLNTMRMHVGKMEIDTVFDSGAECSVMRETVAKKIPGRRQQVVNYLRGLGPVPVISTNTLKTVCTINNINVEILFHVLPDFEMTTNVLIGSDLLSNTGLSVIITLNTATLVSQPQIMHVRSNSSIFSNLNHGLSDQSEIDQLLSLLNRYSYIFTNGFAKTRVNTGQLEIRLKNPDKYVERKPYRLTPIERQKVKSIVLELIENHIVRESKSPYSSPIILVKKKNGDDRLCVDYRELNSNTIRDHYPLPLIGDQIDQLAGGKYFHTLDMASGFHQIPISPESIEKTAFITPDGLYEYLTMPFGLCNAPSVYQRCINRALGQLLNPGSAHNGIDSIAQVYIDDVISKSYDFPSGLTYLERIFIALRDSGFSINVEKCSFFKRSIEYLGNIIEDGKVHPSPKKVDALLKAPIPTSVKQVRQFNGLAGYFRRFIPDFARIMVPLYNLTKQGVKWSWTNDHEEVRQKVIHHLTSSPVLTIFREGEPIELHTDASCLGFGAVLVQVINGRQHVVAYFSMRTTDIESRYHSYELETLAVVRAIKHFRHYLYGRKFKVITDCNALKASEHKKDLLPRIHRWWAYLQNFEFEIEYRKGERMQHADFFSRNPNSFTVNVMTRNLEWLVVEQHRDPQLRPIIDALHNGEAVPGYVLEGNALKYVRTDQVLGAQKLTMVPKSFQWSLINTFHTALKHVGWEKTLGKIKETYYFDKMNTIIREFVDNCVVCRISKQSSGATQVQLHSIPKPTVPFEVIHMDITGKLGTPQDQEYVVVTIDAYT